MMMVTYNKEKGLSSGAVIKRRAFLDGKPSS
jgi:hypothetical protein